jgi:hypothetical protein
LCDTRRASIHSAVLSHLRRLLSFVAFVSGLHFDDGGLEGAGRGAAAIDCAIGVDRIVLSVYRFFEFGVELWNSSVAVSFECCISRFGSAERCDATDEAAEAAGSRAGNGRECAVLCEETEDMARR